MIEDPRLFAKTAKDPCTNQQFSTKNFDPPMPSTDLFWDMEFQRQQFAKRLTISQIKQLQKDRLEKLKSTDFKVTYILNCITYRY